MSELSDEIYICADIETDGPSPGHNSMLSIGAVAFKADKTIMGTFERNLELLPGASGHPDTMKWWKTQSEAWAAHRQNVVAPKAAFEAFVAFAENYDKPVFVAYPVSFDFSFINWYMYEFVGRNPFHLQALDITSYAMGVMNAPYKKSAKPDMPEEWVNDEYEHNHKALDDAMGHAMTFCNLINANKN